ncbi:MAG: nuclear transport factor 2 family protein [Burkholderiales bacterium]
MKRLVVFLLAMAWATSLWAGPREDALAEFEKFFAYFKTDNHDQLVSLFSSDALFIGTISPELVTTREPLREYFVRALTSTRGEVKANLFATTATLLTDDVVLVTAAWQSERTLDGKMTTNGPSRNTSVMHKRGERWYIVQFHNSWKPK